MIYYSYHDNYNLLIDLVFAAMAMLCNGRMKAY